VSHSTSVNPASYESAGSSETPWGPVEAVIFDMDGVLVSSLEVHWKAYRLTFRTQGREFTQEEYFQLASGATREVVIRRVLGDVPQNLLEELMEQKEHHVVNLLEAEGVPTVPGAREFLRDLRALGIKTAVATSSRSPGPFLARADLDHEFPHIVDRRHVEHPKPLPDCYLLAAEKLGVTPERCVVVEDSLTGIEAGVRAGMRVIALTTTEDPEDLARSRATRVYPGFDDIPRDEWFGRA